MKTLVRYLTIGIIAIPMVAAVFSASASAAEPLPRESITLSPVNKRYQVNAGETKTDEMTIVNDGDTDYSFILYARPFSIQNNAYNTPNFTASTSNADAYKWIQFNESQYNIKAGQTLKVSYTMRVPQDTPPGGHYGVIFAETQPTAAQEGSSVARKKRVGMILYATVNGQYRMAGEHVATNIPFLQFRAPLSAGVEVQNDGNSDFIATTTYKVSDLFGQVKFQESKGYAILPQTKREMVLAWDKAPWFGLYRVEATGSFLDKHHSTSGYVLMVPRWLLIVLAVAIVGGVLYAVLRRRR